MCLDGLSLLLEAHHVCNLYIHFNTCICIHCAISSMCTMHIHVCRRDLRINRARSLGEEETMLLPFFECVEHQ